MKKKHENFIKAKLRYYITDKSLYIKAFLDSEAI